VEHPGSIGGTPLVFGERPDPRPLAGEVLVEVRACGVCRTDLHLAEGDLPVRRARCVPGHEIVGTVRERGPGADRFEVGGRVGVAWLRSTCGTCRSCRSHRENLCEAPLFTGWDADGGYAELATAPEAFAYRLPDRFGDAEAAPLLCAGIIGYRALRRAELPPGGRLGIYGFGASAHLAAQVALHEGATVHVMTRSVAAQALARRLGAASAQDADAAPPEPLDAAVLFAPVGRLVPVCLEALDRGGTLSIAGIHLSEIPPLDYQRHLFQERQVRSVTANTRRDGEELLRLAAEIPLRATVTPYPLERAADALRDLAADRVEGAAVLTVG
jgi:propanol-preferring alcohol dehydrogenase